MSDNRVARNWAYATRRNGHFGILVQQDDIDALQHWLDIAEGKGIWLNLFPNLDNGNPSIVYYEKMQAFRCTVCGKTFTQDTAGDHVKCFARPLEVLKEEETDDVPF